MSFKMSLTYTLINFYGQANHIQGPDQILLFLFSPINFLAILKNILELEQWANRNRELRQWTNI